jgi:hypothetical protein
VLQYKHVDVCFTGTCQNVYCNHNLTRGYTVVPWPEALVTIEKQRHQNCAMAKTVVIVRAAEAEQQQHMFNSRSVPKSLQYSTKRTATHVRRDGHS